MDSRLLSLQLVSKVCTELDNHLGLSDKTLAEFVIHLAEGAETCAAFEAKLQSNGAEFPTALSESIFRLIQQMKPAGGGAAASATQSRIRTRGRGRPAGSKRC